MLADGADAGIRSRCARLKCRRGQCSNNKVRRRGPAGCPLLLSSARLPLSPETERDVTLPGHILVPVHAIQANSDERPPIGGGGGRDEAVEEEEEGGQAQGQWQRERAMSLPRRVYLLRAHAAPLEVVVGDESPLRRRSQQGKARPAVARRAPDQLGGAEIRR